MNAVGITVPEGSVSSIRVVSDKLYFFLEASLPKCTSIVGHVCLDLTDPSQYPGIYNTGYSFLKQRTK